MPTLQRQQAIAPVVLGIALRADPKGTEVKHPEGQSADPLERGTLSTEIAPDPATGRRKPRGEDQHELELLPIAAKPPIRVVEVLTSAGLVGTDGLQVAILVRTDPHVGPRRWDNKLLAPRRLTTTEGLLAIEVGESASTTPAAPTGRVARNYPKAGHGLI